MKQVIFRNKKIFYRAEGKGKPVLLIHGFAENSNIWAYQFEKLIEKYYVIAPDLPGSGKSEMLEGSPGVEDYAEAIKAIIDMEVISKNGQAGTEDSFTAIGHSMGGYVLLAFAEKYSQLLNAFGLFHSTAYADDDAKKEARRKGIEFIKNNGVSAFVKSTTPNLFSERTKKEKPQLVEELIKLSDDFSAEALIQYYEAMIKRPDRISVLKSFQRPVLFMIGQQDNAVPVGASLEQCHLPAVSHIHILKNSGHVGMWEEKEESTAFLFNFLAQF
jgi:pimeloyl-ACP methyl ester carboxylesterase